MVYFGLHGVRVYVTKIRYVNYVKACFKLERIKIGKTKDGKQITLVMYKQRQYFVRMCECPLNSKIILKLVSVSNNYQFKGNCILNNLCRYFVFKLVL